MASGAVLCDQFNLHWSSWLILEKDTREMICTLQKEHNSCHFVFCFFRKQCLTLPNSSSTLGKKEQINFYSWKQFLRNSNLILWKTTVEKLLFLKENSGIFSTWPISHKCDNCNPIDWRKLWAHHLSCRDFGKSYKTRYITISSCVSLLQL